MNRLLLLCMNTSYGGMVVCSVIFFGLCIKTTGYLPGADKNSGDSMVKNSDTSTPQSAPGTSRFKGLNWADPGDNFSSGNVVPSGLSASDSYATTQSKANNILAAFQRQGANTIRIPVNPITVAGTWWGCYTSAIDAAISMGMNVILGYWEASGSGDGLVDDTTGFWNMWKTVVNKYGNTSKVYFEVYNEPHGYTVSALNNLYAEWLSKYSSVPAGRVLLDGAGYAINVNDVGADSRLSGCLLSYHNYTWFNKNLTTAGEWEAAIQSINYPSRTIMTEFGVPMTTGNNYLGSPGSNRDIAYLQGVTNQLRAIGLGGVYWPGLRTGDSFSLLTLSGNMVSVNNSSGLSRLQYAWGNIRIDQPYGK